jgi:hypothetical protein
MPDVTLDAFARILFSFTAGLWTEFDRDRLPKAAFEPLLVCKYLELLHDRSLLSNAFRVLVMLFLAGSWNVTHLQIDAGMGLFGLYAVCVFFFSVASSVLPLRR